MISYVEIPKDSTNFSELIDLIVSGFKYIAKTYCHLIHKAAEKKQENSIFDSIKKNF